MAEPGKKPDTPPASTGGLLGSAYEPFLDMWEESIGHLSKITKKVSTGEYENGGARDDLQACVDRAGSTVQSMFTLWSAMLTPAKSGGGMDRFPKSLRGASPGLDEKRTVTVRLDPKPKGTLITYGLFRFGTSDIGPNGPSSEIVVPPHVIAITVTPLPLSAPDEVTVTIEFPDNLIPDGVSVRGGLYDQVDPSTPVTDADRVGTITLPLPPIS